MHKIAIPQFLLERYARRRGKPHAFDRLEAAVSLFQALGGGWQKPKEDGPATTGEGSPKP